MADDLTSTASEIELRDATPEDRNFLLALYASTRADEMGMLPWDDAAKAAFIEMQFRAQDADYRRTYPDGHFLVVLRDGAPVGRLYHARLADEIHVIDIALIPAHRGRGIGSRLLAGLLSEADDAGLAVRLHVESWSRAVGLYERLGFRAIGEPSMHQLMERRPS